MKVPKTCAEREQFLLNDPLVILHGPSCVECKQCNKMIKLSTKSDYDLFHWRNHRARCSKAMQKSKKQKIQSSPPQKSVSAPQKPAVSREKKSRESADGPSPKSSTPSSLVDLSERSQRVTHSPDVHSPVPDTPPRLPASSVNSAHVASLFDIPHRVTLKVSSEDVVKSSIPQPKPSPPPVDTQARPISSIRIPPRHIVKFPLDLQPLPLPPPRPPQLPSAHCIPNRCDRLTTSHSQCPANLNTERREQLPDDWKRWNWSQLKGRFFPPTTVDQSLDDSGLRLNWG